MRMDVDSPVDAWTLPLTGERTVPGIPEENYWFRRHEIAYRFTLPLVSGRRVLEVGCGLGLPSLVAAAAGGRVLATDWAPDAIAAVRLNAARNDLTLDTLVADWRAPAALVAHGPWDLVIAADVLYERRNAAPLQALLEALAAETWLADPGRAPADQLLADLELAGWDRSILAETRRPRVTVHRLRPGRMS